MYETRSVAVFFFQFGGIYFVFFRFFLVSYEFVLNRILKKYELVESIANEGYLQNMSNKNRGAVVGFRVLRIFLLKCCFELRFEYLDLFSFWGWFLLLLLTQTTIGRRSCRPSCRTMSWPARARARRTARTATTSRRCSTPRRCTT